MKILEREKNINTVGGAMKIVLTNQIKIITTPQIEQQIVNKYTFANPKYQEAVDFGRSTHAIDKTIRLVERTDKGLIAPMGALNYLKTFSPDITDERATVPANIPFTGTLRPYQKTFIADAIKAGGGAMVAATGSGKTISSIAMASRLKQRVLILVKSKVLAEQWREAIKQFTGLESGLIGAGKNIEGEQFTIGLTQTLCKRDLSVLNYGLVIADECHNLPASQAYAVMNGLNARYKYGLSATPERRDNLEFMIAAAIGGVCSKIEQNQLQGKVLPVHVSTIEIPFDAEVESWTEFLNILVDDEQRNQVIIDNAVKASKTMGTIILCSQVRHCELLSVMCNEAGAKPLVLHGQLPAKIRVERMAQAAQSQLIIGTLSLLSEGIDLPHLSALLFASPVSASIDKDNPAATRLIQSIGRCRRPFKNKSRAFVLDIIDQCGFGVAAFNKRKHIYRLQNFVVAA